MSYESKLLATARRMPEASGIVRYVDELFETWRVALDIEMDRDIFSARALIAAPRYAIKGTLGLALDPIWLAAVVCASARLDLNHEQLMTLRADIEKVNRKIVELLAEMRESRDV